MKLNALDLGTYNPLRQFHIKQMLGDTTVENAGRIAWRRGGEPSQITVRHWVIAPAAIGGSAAATQGANEFLIRWLEELAGNEDMQPFYVQWSSLRSLPQDGWWFMSDATPDYKYTGGGAIPVDMTFIQKAPGGSPVNIYYAGGALTSTYTVGPTNLIAVPLNSIGLAASGSRPGAEGAVAYMLSPALDPVQIQPGNVLTDLFKGGCHVYDANGTLGANPVPVDGTFVNANWVEVFGTDHRFVGDIVITNGLVLVTIQLQTAINVWVWNDKLAPAQWNQVGQIQSWDNAGNQGTLTSMRFQRLGYEEVNLDLFFTNVQAAMVRIRVQRGQYIVYTGFRPQTYANSSTRSLVFVPAVAGNVIAYNSARVVDQQFAAERIALAATADAGYGSCYLHSASALWVASWLYQSPPAGQPNVPLTGIGLGDTVAPVQNGWGFYGLGLTPFPTTVNLQSEAESGVLAGTAAAQADGAASGGNTVKFTTASATGSDIFGTAWQPPAGTYYSAFRVKVTSAAGAVAEFQMGIWDTTAGAFLAGANTIFKANQAATSYVWLVCPAFTAPAGHNLQFRAVDAATLGTDWFVDEAVLLPITLATYNDGPKELWQQFAYERTSLFPVL